MKGKSKTIFTIVIILIIVLIGLFGYYEFEEFTKEKNGRSVIASEKFNSMEQTNKIYQDSEVLTKSNYNYLVIMKDNKWYEIDHNYSEDNTGFKILGAYNDKFYYADLKGIKYVDLNDESLKIVDFSMMDKVNNEKIYMSYFYADTLYIEVDNTDETADGDTTDYSLISYNLFDNYTNKSGKKLTIIKDGPVNYYVIKDRLYYLHNSKSEEYKLYSYNIKDNKSSIITNHVCDMDIYKDHLIITKKNPIASGDICSLHYFINADDNEMYVTNKELHFVIGDSLYFQNNNKIYKFIEKTGDIKYISDGKISYMSDQLYYLNDNKIYKYENDKNQIIYTSDDYEIRGFNVKKINDKDVLYIYTKDESYVVVDGVKKDTADKNHDILKYKVNMKDGSVKTFDYSSEDTNEDIVYDEELEENEE